MWRARKTPALAPGTGPSSRCGRSPPLCGQSRGARFLCTAQALMSSTKLLLASRPNLASTRAAATKSEVSLPLSDRSGHASRTAFERHEQ
jgi:hypothetical protein